jgi:hypothetical protein
MPWCGYAMKATACDSWLKITSADDSEIPEPSTSLTERSAVMAVKDSQVRNLDSKVQQLDKNGGALTETFAFRTPQIKRSNITSVTSQEKRPNSSQVIKFPMQKATFQPLLSVRLSPQIEPAMSMTIRVGGSNAYKLCDSELFWRKAPLAMFPPARCLSDSTIRLRRTSQRA